MHIALIGASSFVGSALLEEALARGHRVTAVVSNPRKLKAQANLEAVQVDVLEDAALTDALRGHDAEVSAFSGHAQKDILGYYMRGIRSIIAAAKRAGVPRKGLRERIPPGALRAGRHRGAACTSRSHFSSRRRCSTALSNRAKSIGTNLMSDHFGATAGTGVARFDGTWKYFI